MNTTASSVSVLRPELVKPKIDREKLKQQLSLLKAKRTAGELTPGDYDVARREALDQAQHEAFETAQSLRKMGEKYTLQTIDV